MAEVIVPAEETPPMETPGDAAPDSLAKFKDENGAVDDAKVQSAYVELEKEYSKLKAAQAEDKPEEPNQQGEEPPPQKETPSPPASDAQDAAAEALSVAGLNMIDFQQEFADTGQLSENSYKTLAEKGFSKDVVDTYIKGIQSDVENAQAVAQTTVDEIHHSFGGAEEYNNAVAWANQNLPDHEKAFFQRAAKSGDLDGLRMAAESLRLKYFQANPQRPKLVRGTAAPKGGVTGYNSLEEMRRDMADPRYKNDPAFIESVKQKMAVSNLFGG